jgi:nitroreductase
MPSHSEKLAILYGRRSVRVYTSESVSDELVAELLMAAMAAPSACAKDPWRFVVVRERSTLERIAAALPNGKMLPRASVGIVVCGDLSAAHDRQISYLLQDCSAAIQNFLVAAHGLGLGACWLGVHPREDRVSAIRAVLGIPDGVVPVSAIAVGWPAEQHRPRTRFDASYVHNERW